MILRFLHLITAVGLTLSHSIFLFRGLTIVRRSGKPQTLDRVTRGLAQVLLPVTIVLGGILLLAGTDRAVVLHGILGFLPLLMILLLNGLRLLLRGDKRILRLLPLGNLILILLAMITGFVNR
jgi:hypothetical protein